MGKSLLSMAFVALAAMTASADSYTITFATGGNTSAAFVKDSTNISSGMEYVASVDSVSNTTGKTVGGMRVGQNKNPGKIRFILSDAGKVNATSIVVRACGGKNATTGTTITMSVNYSATQNITRSAAANPASTDWTDYTYEVTGELSSIILATNLMVNVQSITVNYGDPGQPTAPSAPSITGTATFWGDSTPITITAGNGCDVYYTLDGSTPTTSSTKYTEPFNITATTTVKAIAVREGLSSTVAEATFTKGTIEEVATIKDFLSKETGTVCKFTAPLTVVYQNKGYLFVKDETGGLQFFTGSINTNFPGTYLMGQKLTGIVAQKDVYAQNPQAAVKDFLTSFPTEASGEETIINPTVIDAADVANHLNEYVVLGDQTVTKTGSNYFCGTVQLYNRFGLSALTDSYLEGKWDVAGFAVVYNTTPEIYYTKIDTTGLITGVENVAVENGNVYGAEGYIVAPEGAQVYTVSGAKVGNENLPAGIYVVIVSGKAQKVIVK